ncbi:glycosyltransferase [Nocardioides sp. C4-1]|uniref:glycosyltransferase n=1 Tax=Nocardioides sp. C4-1 TaxID=3151851 RepID=UPI003266C2AF
MSAYGRVRLEGGGKTVAMLARNRMITTRLAIPTTVLTFDSSPSYAAVRDGLLERGDLAPGMQLLNTYEWYRDTARPETGEDVEAGERGGGGRLVDLAHLEPVDTPHPDGSVHRTEYLDEAGTVVARDYRRHDGSVYVRIAQDAPRAQLVDPDGVVVRSFPGVPAWRRHWLRTLVRQQHTSGHTSGQTVVVTDTDTVLRELWQVEADVRFVHVLHEVHVQMTGEPPASAPIRPSLQPVLDQLERLDRLVVLSEVQRDDVVVRLPPVLRDRVVVLPLDTETAPPLDAKGVPATVAPRARAGFVMLGRLTPVKAVHEAVEVFALVVAHRPEARLDVYGEGPLRPELEQLITQRGLANHVRLRGFDETARDRLHEATAYVLTSSKETFGLAALEALGRGCPVVAYDVPYAPARIHDGVDGFRVPPGDRQAMAERIITMIDDPDLVQRMSEASHAAARRYEPARVAEEWRTLLAGL